MAFSTFRRAQLTKEPSLIRFKWIDEVILAIEHQNGNLHSGSEINFIDFR